VELQVGEFEHQFFQRFGLGLGRWSDVCGVSLPQSDEDRVHRRLDPTRIAAHRDVHRFLTEQHFQHTGRGAIQQERDDRELVLAPLLLQVECTAQFSADPPGLQRIRANHHGIGRGVVNGFLDCRPQWIATAQLARIDPTILTVVGERCTEIAHERVVLGAVGDKEFGHV
jgi:hypothetical protein